MVRLTNKRNPAASTDKSTIGRLYLEECGFLCHILEPPDRGLEKSMPIDEIRKKKVYGSTAIPKGEYEIRLLVSPSMKDKSYAKKYGGRFPYIMDVPGFDSVLFHPGNTPKDTKACQLPGDFDPSRPDYVANSVEAYKTLMDFYLWPAFLRGDKITYKVE